jgi:uncharacterized protein
VTKALLVLLVLFLGWTLWKKRHPSRRVPPAGDPERSRRQTQADQRAHDPALAEAMVPCARCGLHVPASEALTDGQRVYCSADHLRRGPPSRP